MEWYLYSDGTDIAIAASTLLYDTGELLGVLSVDLSLNKSTIFYVLSKLENLVRLLLLNAMEKYILKKEKNESV